MSQQYKNSDKNNSLRGSLGQFPTGVAIVTALTENLQPVGMTINSFNSVSLTPALISWCIDHRAASYKTFARAKSFTVTVLAEDQATWRCVLQHHAQTSFRVSNITVTTHPSSPMVVPGLNVRPIARSYWETIRCWWVKSSNSAKLRYSR